MDSFAEPPNSRARADLALSLEDVNAQVSALEAEYKQKGIELTGRIIHATHYLPLTATLAPLKTGVLSPPLTPPLRSNDVAPSPTSESAPDFPPAQPQPQPQQHETATTATTDSSVNEPSVQEPTTSVPATTPATATTISTSTSSSRADRWIIGPRWGHSAMFSGITSLGATREQIVIGWTGDLQKSVPPSGSDNSGANDSAIQEKVRIPTANISPEDREALVEAIERFSTSETDEDELDVEDKDKSGGKTKYVPVWLDDKIAHGHYDGYCKTTLWPLFHYLLWQDVATEAASVDLHWHEYQEANYRYALQVAEIYKPGDLVWVHDYHLLLVPHLLRQIIPDVICGLFVHTPFPSSEIFRCLPKRREVLDGMLGANLVCFQTYSYSRHFVSSCIRVCGYEIASGIHSVGAIGGGMGIDVQGHVTTVTHCPVGVDAERIARDAVREGVKPKLEALKTLYEGKKIIVARDKLDAVKGVVQKLRAFERLLRDNPEWVGNVVLIQVTSPALSDSPKLERQVSELVASINGEFGALDFVPVHHYHQTIKRDEFYALLSVADLAVITPLRDGMNTTSMEFVIAQERTKKSALVLSEFMGISSTMEDALQVNPWDLGGVAAAIHRGLKMGERERENRHVKLYKSVTTHTSRTWASMLIRLLLSQIGSDHVAKHSTPILDREKMKKAYKAAKRRLFLFDYDGTLTPIVKTPWMAVPSKETLEALQRLSEDEERNVVYIISGRDAAFLDQHLGHIKKLGMSAEHGSFLREPGSHRHDHEEPGLSTTSEWKNLTEELDMSWMSEVEAVFRYYTERTAGSHIEIKKSSITWHYRSSDPEWGLFQCRQCQDLLENNVAHKRPIEVLVGKKNLEVRPLAVNKGEIVKKILERERRRSMELAKARGEVWDEDEGVEFVFCAGDDKTDEDMFRALVPFTSTSTPILTSGAEGIGKKSSKLGPETVFPTSVGASNKKTLASWHVTTPGEVVESMLELVNAA